MKEINYNVRTFINNEDNNMDIEKVFNQKLLKIIFLLEKYNYGCQDKN